MRASPTVPAPSARAVYGLALLLFAAQILGWAVVDGESRDRRDQARSDAVAACSRGNVVRANEHIDIRDPDDSPAERVRVKAIFPLLDCEQTLAQRRPVLLADTEVRTFVDLVEVSRIPVVVDGRVVTSTPAPAVSSP